MNSIGVDLHKHLITVCVINDEFVVIARKTLRCIEPDTIVAFLKQFQPFNLVVEATASYHWFVGLVDPIAAKVVLAHPNKMRVIAESTKKTDRLDAQVLAEFLALDMIPRAHIPTPRQRQHRSLVRHRQYIRSETTSLKNKIRRILSDYNADRRDLFTTENPGEYIAQVGLNDADGFVMEQLWANLKHFSEQLTDLTKKLNDFAKKAPHREKEAREVLKTIPGVGAVTIDVLISELGDVTRFRNAKAVCAYAGLVPVVRQSGGKKSKELRISKEGSGLLRWALVESAWRITRTSKKWQQTFERIAKRAKRRRAIVAIARKLLCVIYAMLKTMTPYRI